METLSYIRSAPVVRRIALIAHDNKKQEMLEWAELNLVLLGVHELFATATTGRVLRERLGLPVTCFRSGPLGGDQQIGSRIAEGEIDLLVFLCDPLASHPHDVDVKALLRIAVVCNIPTACNRATADLMISSPLMSRARPPHVMAPRPRVPGDDGCVDARLAVIRPRRAASRRVRRRPGLHELLRPVRILMRGPGRRQRQAGVRVRRLRVAVVTPGDRAVMADQ
jgi:methylglyoxal synthase